MTEERSREVLEEMSARYRNEKFAEVARLNRVFLDADLKHLKLCGEACSAGNERNFAREQLDKAKAELMQLALNQRS